MTASTSKPKPCNYTKYGFVACGMLVEWDPAISRTREVNNGMAEHTKESCISYKNQKDLADKGNAAVGSAYTDKNQLTRIEQKFDTIINLLESWLINQGLTQNAKQLRDSQGVQ